MCDDCGILILGIPHDMMHCSIINVNKCRCIYPREFSRLYNVHPWYWNSLLYGLISGENSAHFLQLMPLIIFQFFVPPGHCWVGRGSMECEVCPTFLHMISNGKQIPDPLILSSNALPTSPQAPKSCIMNISTIHDDTSLWYGCMVIMYRCMVLCTHHLSISQCWTGL